MSANSKFAVASDRLVIQTVAGDMPSMFGLESNARDLSPRQAQRARKIARAFRSVK